MGAWRFENGMMIGKGRQVERLACKMMMEQKGYSQLDNAFFLERNEGSTDRTLKMKQNMQGPCTLILN